jgi:predicted nucleotidyltransferase
MRSDSKSLDTLRTELRDLLPELRQEYPIAYLGIFGSWVRGEQTPDSDLDVLVEFEEPISLFRYLQLQARLEARLGLSVDLVQRSGLKPFIGDRILAEAIAV